MQCNPFSGTILNVKFTCRLFYFLTLTSTLTCVVVVINIYWSTYDLWPYSRYSLYTDQLLINMVTYRAEIWTFGDELCYEVEPGWQNHAVKQRTMCLLAYGAFTMQKLHQNGKNQKFGCRVLCWVIEEEVEEGVRLSEAHADLVEHTDEGFLDIYRRALTTNLQC